MAHQAAYPRRLSAQTFLPKYFAPQGRRGLGILELGTLLSLGGPLPEKYCNQVFLPNRPRRWLMATEGGSRLTEGTVPEIEIHHLDPSSLQNTGGTGLSEDTPMSSQTSTSPRRSSYHQEVDLRISAQITP